MADSAPASAAAEATRVAVVTGGSSGIGQAVAVALAGRRYSVAIVGRTRSRLDQTLGLLTQASSPSVPHLALALDVTDEDDMTAMAARTVEALGRIDVLVASAGLGKRSDSERLMPHPTARRGR